MTLTLSATLQTAQDGINHRPAINLSSSPAESAIPYRGNYFSSETLTESNKDMIETSAGRLINVFVKDSNLYLQYTNTDKTEWSIPVLIYNPTSTVYRATICELTGGNIGVISVRSGYIIEYLIVSPVGVVVTGATTIQAGLDWVGKPSVIKMASGDYLLAYPEGTAIPPDITESYYLKYRTSSNFTSWSGATTITTSPLDVNYYMDGCDLLQIASDRIFLHFDYMNSYDNEVELNNIYYMISDNDGVAWTTPVAVTTYTSAGYRAMNPSVEEKDNGDLAIVYQLERSVIYFDENMDGWPSGEDFPGGGMQYNEATQTLIVQNTKVTPGIGFRNICEIDCSDNTFQRYWDYGTSPACHSEWSDTDIQPIKLFTEGNSRLQSTCELLIHGSSSGKVFCVQDLINNKFTYYHESPVNGDSINDPGNFQVGHYEDLELGWDWWDGAAFMIRKVSDTDRRIYIAIGDRRDGNKFVFGYIDADDIADPISGLYTFHELVYTSSSNADGFLGCGSVTTSIAFTGVYWIPELSYFVLCSEDGGTPDPGAGIAILNEDGEFIARHNQTVNAGMPWHGVYDLCYIAETNSLYFTFQYHSSYPDQRGLGQLNVGTGVVTYHEPTWFTCTAECGLRDPVPMGDGRILMTCYATDGGGVAIFDTDTESWTIYNSDTLPGMFCPAAGSEYGWASQYGALNVQYDSNTKIIYAAYQDFATAGYCGVIVFSELGAFSTLQYSDVTTPDGTPAYSTPIDYSYFTFEYNPCLVITSDGSTWLVWHHLDSDTEDSLVWANSLSDLDVHDFLSDAHPLEIEWDVEKPNKLTAVFSHGHLFDTLNTLSTYSIYFKMGRVLTLQLGETVATVDYFQNQGKFMVRESALVYSEEYPVIKVVAEDLRTLWEDTHITASEYFSGETPKTVTENLLVDHGGLEGADYDIPTYDDSHDLYHQFIDMNLQDAIQLIMDHFFYYPFVNVDGVFEPRKVDLDKAIDHAYTGAEIIEYTPDSSFATFLNQIIVTGMSNVFSEILYEEESITNINGTVGHWGGNKEITVWYSKDHTTTCRYPRLEIIQSTKDFKIWGVKAGGGEQITSVDEDELYLIITIDIPDLTDILYAAIVALLALGAAAVGCDGVYTGWCGVVIYGLMIVINLITMILGAVANYSYNIWARPIGHERKTFQAQADDLDFQQQLNGKIVSETIDDPFCYSIASCQTVADFEMAIVTAQRSRLRFKKTCHLQDEVGDKISIEHPYSGITMNTLVTNIKRVITFGKSAAMIDYIEGWKV